MHNTFTENNVKQFYYSYSIAGTLYYYNNMYYIALPSKCVKFEGAQYWL